MKKPKSYGFLCPYYGCKSNLLTSKKNFCLKELFGFTVYSRYKSIKSM